MYGGAHAALSCVVVNGLPYGGECGEEYHRVCLLFKLVGVLCALQFVACCIVERFGSNEVVHVQVAVVAVFCHLLAVNGIAVLRIYLLGSDLLKTIEVAFAAVTIAAFVFKLVAHPGGPVLGIAARGLHRCHHPASPRHVVAWFGLLVFYCNVSAERQGHTFEKVGASREVTMDDKLICTITFYKIRISVAIDVNKCIFRTTYAFRYRRFYTWCQGEFQE